MLVLDSWPLLEWIKGREPARTHFNSLAREAMTGRLEFHISRINYGEAIYSIHKATDIADVESALQRLRSAPICVHTVDDALVDEAVDLKSRHAFSFADAFAAALAIRLGAPLVTGDREFRSLEEHGSLQLRWVGA
jgi:uncharacterized protein